MPAATTGNTHSLSLAKASSQYVTVADAADLDPTNLSVGIWAKAASVFAPSANRAVFDHRDGSAGGWLVYFQGTGSADVARMRLLVNTAGGLYQVSWDADPDVGAWHKYDFAYDSTAQVAATKLFIDGVDQGACDVINGTGTDIAGAIADGDVGLTIGARLDGTDPWDGKLDGAYVMSTVRTEAEALAGLNTQFEGDESGLVAAWNFNGDLTDATGNGHDGTGVNSPTFTTDTPF